MKKQNKIIDKAMRIAYEAHYGQWRRCGKVPYISHPACVAEKLSNEDALVQATAWLHDTLEDTKVTAESLIEDGIPKKVVDAVKVLTKGKEPYEKYLGRVKSNKMALKVKIADILHNLSDNPTQKQIKKYANALLYLCS